MADDREAASRTRRGHMGGGAYGHAEDSFHAWRSQTAALTLSAAQSARSDGHLRILYWQAVSTSIRSRAADIEAASLVLEPLARYDDSGTMIRRSRRNSHRGERRRRGRPPLHHLDAQAGRDVVRRHALHRRRRGVLRRVLPERGDGLQPDLQLQRCQRDRGTGRSHRQNRLRRRQALSPGPSSAPTRRSCRRRSSRPARARAHRPARRRISAPWHGPFKVDEFRANDVANERSASPASPPSPA